MSSIACILQIKYVRKKLNLEEINDLGENLREKLQSINKNGVKIKDEHFKYLEKKRGRHIYADLSDISPEGLQLMHITVPNVIKGWQAIGINLPGFVELVPTLHGD